MGEQTSPEAEIADNAQATLDVIDLMTGGWRAQALYTSVKLGLADQIMAGQTTCRELAQATGADEDGIRRLMRLLVAMKVFEHSGPDAYKNTAVSRRLIDGSQSLRDLCLLYGEEFYQAWSHSYHAISTATSGFEVAYSQSLYTYLGRDAETARRFQHAMNAGNMFFDHVPGAFEFSGGKRIVDVGGGGGQLLAAILSATPDASGVLFDRDHMLPEARRHLAAAVGLHRVEFAAGDMFTSVPMGGDVYLLCRVLAGWDDDAVVVAFENCRRAMADSSARLLVIDRMVVDHNPTVLPSLWDLHLLMTTGGRHRTRDSFVGLLDRACLDVERIVELPMETTALIAAARPDV